VTQRFCLDTSFLINGWNKRYPVNVFPALWDALSGLMGRQLVFSCEEVYNELKHQQDALFDWAKARRAAFEKPNEEILEELARIMAQFRNFAAQGGGSRNRADPFVIAHARVAGAVVVTDEEPVQRQKPTKPPKIPNVCEEIGVLWMPPADFLAAAGIVFGAISPPPGAPRGQHIGS